MIGRTVDKFGRDHIIVVGTVIGNEPKEMYSGSYKKISFRVRYDFVKVFTDNNKPSEDGTPRTYTFSHQSIVCSIYANPNIKSNYSMFHLCRSIRVGETVEVKGKLYEYTVTNFSGEDVECVEIRVESILLPDRLAEVLLQKKATYKDVFESGNTIYMEKKKENESDDEYLF